MSWISTQSVVMRALLLGLLGLVGCAEGLGEPLPGDDPLWAVVETTGAYWLADEELPAVDLEACFRGLDVVLLYPDEAEVLGEYCLFEWWGGCNCNECAHGFYTSTHTIYLGAYEGLWLPQVLAHETLHALQACAGLPLDHADPRLWGAGGLLDAVWENGL